MGVRDTTNSKPYHVCFNSITDICDAASLYGKNDRPSVWLFNYDYWLYKWIMEMIASATFGLNR